MKFALDDGTQGYAIQSYSEGVVVVNNRHLRRSLIVMPDQLIDDWRPQAFAELSDSDFAGILQLKPDIVLLGTGSRQRFPQSSLYRELVSAGIGLEIMGTPAACRTYNILMSEGRRVAAAMLLAD